MLVKFQTEYNIKHYLFLNAIILVFLPNPILTDPYRSGQVYFYTYITKGKLTARMGSIIGYFCILINFLVSISRGNH